MWCQKRVVHNFASHYWVDVLQSFSCLSHHFEINNMSRIYIHSRLTKRKSKLPRAPCRPGTWLFRWVRNGGFKAQRLTPANLIIVRFMCVSATIWCHSALYVLKYTSKAGQTRGGSFKRETVYISKEQFGLQKCLMLRLRGGQHHCAKHLHPPLNNGLAARCVKLATHSAPSLLYKTQCETTEKEPYAQETRGPQQYTSTSATVPWMERIRFLKESDKTTS